MNEETVNVEFVGGTFDGQQATIARTPMRALAFGEKVAIYSELGATQYGLRYGLTAAGRLRYYYMRLLERMS